MLVRGSVVTLWELIVSLIVTLSLLAAGFGFRFQRFELRALFRCKHIKHLGVRAFLCAAQFGAERFKSRLLFACECAALFALNAKVAQFFAQCFRASGVAFGDCAHLRALRVA